MEGSKCWFHTLHSQLVCVCVCVCVGGGVGVCGRRGIMCTQRTISMYEFAQIPTHLQLCLKIVCCLATIMTPTN